jgi:HD-like signal output (HDOD) protein
MLSLSRVFQLADSLPSGARVLAELQGMLQHADCGLDEVTVLLRRDPGMTARIIRIANGVVYNKGGPVASLEEALGRVGLEEVYRLAGIACAAQVTSFQLRFYPYTATRLQENALFVALLMEELAPVVNTDARAAYTAGLLRSAGKIALDTAAQRDLRGRPVPPMAESGILDWENALFGLGNPRVAESLLRGWKFPFEVYIAIRDHYLEGLSVEAVIEAKLLNFAAATAEARGFGLEGESVYWAKHGERAREKIPLDDDALRALVERVAARFERMRATLG